MIGKNFIEIGAAELALGMSTGAHTLDGGFSPETTAVNLTAVPGVMYPPANPVDISWTFSSLGDAIAFCPTNVTLLNGFALTVNGYILKIDSTPSFPSVSAQLTGTYTTGTSDIVNFIDKIYATSTTDVARMDTNLTNGDYDWWSLTLGKGVLTSGTRHPMVVFQDLLWVGDNNKLHNIVDSGTGNASVLTLSIHNEITALGVDPSSGKMLIAATQGSNYSNTLSSGNRVFLYDGTSATYTREYAVDGMVTGFRSVGGITYVFYGGNKIGYWNGSGITFLRKLKNVTLSGADIPYKHHVTNIDNTLYIVDGKQVLAFGEVLPGRKVWYYCYFNNVNSNKLGLLCPIGSKLLGLGFATSKFYTLDTTSVATGEALTFTSNFYKFPRPVYIRSARIEYDGSVPNNDANRSFTYKTQTNTSFQALASITNSTGASIYENADIIGFADDKVTALQLQYSMSITVVGVRRILVYYDVAE